MDRRILATAISASLKYVGLAYADKILEILEVVENACYKDWKIICKILLNKKVTSMAFLEEGQDLGCSEKLSYKTPLPNTPALTIVVADKAGMAYKYFLSRSMAENGGNYTVFGADNYSLDTCDRNIMNQQKPPLDAIKSTVKPILGHVSMLLDILFSPDGKCVITCDRDEKIRVTHYPRCYDIQSFCLGHTKFVTSVCISPSWPEILFSGSADGSIRAWRYIEGKLLTTAFIKSKGVKDKSTDQDLINKDPMVAKIIVRNSPVTESGSALANTELLLAALIKEGQRSSVNIYKVRGPSNGGELVELESLQTLVVADSCSSTMEDIWFGFRDHPCRLYLLKCSPLPSNQTDGGNGKLRSMKDQIEAYTLRQKNFSFALGDGLNCASQNGDASTMENDFEFNVAERLLFQKGQDFYDEIDKDQFDDGSTEYYQSKKLKKQP